MRRLVALAALLAAPAAFAQTPLVQLRLSGTTTSGVAVTDEAAFVRFLPNARTGFDVNDASKLFPLAATFAIIAPRGERDGQPTRLSVNSLPDGTLPDGTPGQLGGPVAVPVDLYTTEGGAFTLRWNGPTQLPAGWNVSLRDIETGTVVNLRSATSYAFTAGATNAWAGRFELVFAPGYLADVAGWRLLSPPVEATTVGGVTYAGLPVGRLADLNLVQGVAGGGAFAAQYPLAGSNILTGYAGAFTPPATTADLLEAGRGFFWYLYDAAFTPTTDAFGPGTSRSRDVFGFKLGVSGTAPSADVTRTFLRSPDGYLLAGNPFGASFAVGGMTATGGQLAQSVQVYDPGSATVAPSYVTRFFLNPTTGTSDAVAPWQGFFAEVSGVPVGTNPALTYPVASTQPTDAAFVGRGAPDALAVHLTLDGATDDGPTRDEAAYVRLRDGASAGYDAHDASKLALPPVAAQALIAPVGTRDGAAFRQSVVSRPVAPAVVPVAFTASAAGSFTLRWDEARIPDGWTATLRDLATGAVVDLAAAERYAFTAEATDWAERFELSLASATTAQEAEAPAALSLGVPVPNPARSASRLRLVTAQAGRVVATVVDALGRTVLTAFEGEVAAGAATDIAIDVRTLAPGAYTVRVVTPEAVEARRLVVVR